MLCYNSHFVHVYNRTLELKVLVSMLIANMNQSPSTMSNRWNKKLDDNQKTYYEETDCNRIAGKLYHHLSYPTVSSVLGQLPVIWHIPSFNITEANWAIGCSTWLRKSPINNLFSLLMKIWIVDEMVGEKEKKQYGHVDTAYSKVSGWGYIKDTG